jgi:hypothetical protein
MGRIFVSPPDRWRGKLHVGRMSRFAMYYKELGIDDGASSPSENALKLPQPLRPVGAFIGFFFTQ